MNVQQWNNKAAEERVVCPPRATAEQDLSFEIWRRVPGHQEAGRTLLISNKGKYKDVDTEALLYGGNLLSRAVKGEPDLAMRDSVFPLEREEYSQ